MCVSLQFTYTHAQVQWILVYACVGVYITITIEEPSQGQIQEHTITVHSNILSLLEEIVITREYASS